MKILFWDIDGTIMRTAKAGIFAFQQAAEQLLARPVHFEKITTAGMTDYHIAAEIIRINCGHDPSAAEITTLIHRYEQVLPAHLAAAQGRLMPFVPEILAHFHARPDYVSLLLTGNSYSGAQAKLQRYGVADYFDFGLSAFGGQSPIRAEIAARALIGVQAAFPEVGPDDIYIIGDTPNDIRCGQAIGARTIAVATGMYSLGQLTEHNPWWAVESLPAPALFEKRLAEG